MFLKLTFSIVAEAHLGLTEANGVFACANAIELLQFRLVNALNTQLVSWLLKLTPEMLSEALCIIVRTWLGK